MQGGGYFVEKKLRGRHVKIVDSLTLKFYIAFVLRSSELGT